MSSVSAFVWHISEIARESQHMGHAWKYLALKVKAGQRKKQLSTRFIKQNCSFSSHVWKICCNCNTDNYNLGRVVSLQEKSLIKSP